MTGRDIDSETPSVNTTELTVALLKESMKLYDFRLMKLENKFDKLQETLNSRFDKIDMANESRRKEAQEFQEKIATELRKVAEVANKSSEKIAENERKIHELEKRNAEEIQKIQEEVNQLSSLKLKILGAIGIITCLFAIFGRDLFKFLIS